MPCTFSSSAIRFSCNGYGYFSIQKSHFHHDPCFIFVLDGLSPCPADTFIENWKCPRSVQVETAEAEFPASVNSSIDKYGTDAPISFRHSNIQLSEPWFEFRPNSHVTINNIDRAEQPFASNGNKSQRHAPGRRVSGKQRFIVGFSWCTRQITPLFKMPLGKKRDYINSR